MTIKCQNRAEYQRNWKRNNPEKVVANNRRLYNKRKADPNRREQLRDKWLQENYGITEDEYSRILLEQGGSCAICNVSATTQQHGRLHVDHCHETKIVRGLLCFSCNVGMGYFKHSTSTLEKATKYLKKTEDEIAKAVQSVGKMLASL